MREVRYAMTATHGDSRGEGETSADSQVGSGCLPSVTDMRAVRFPGSGADSMRERYRVRRGFHHSRLLATVVSVRSRQDDAPAIFGRQRVCAGRIVSAVRTGTNRYACARALGEHGVSAFSPLFQMSLAQGSAREFLRRRNPERTRDD